MNVKIKNITVSILVTILFVTAGYHLYWLFGPLQMKEIHIDEIEQKETYISDRHNFKVNAINKNQTLVSALVGNSPPIKSIEEYFFVEDNGLIKIYIVTNVSDDGWRFPFGGYHKWILHYKFNKEIDENKIQVFTKGKNDEKFIKMTNKKSINE